MAATQERSAGFIVFHRPAGGAVRYLVLNYGKHWDFAKGHVEAGESDLQAARRELLEETGIQDVTVVPGFARQIRYFFRHGKRGLIHKSVIFFLAESTGEAVVLSHEHEGHAWLEAEAALARVTYANAKSVLQDAISELATKPLTAG